MSEPIPEDIRNAALAVVERGYDEGLLDAVCRALMVERARWFDVLLADAKAFVKSPLSDECDRQAFTLLAHFVLDKMKPGWRDTPPSEEEHPNAS